MKSSQSGTRPRTSSSRSPLRLDIQGLRAIAVLQVVAFHAGLPVPGGFFGVDVFFVISGFVITGMLLREWNSTGCIRFGRFYARRFKRLTPALAVMAAVTVGGSAVLLSPIMRQQAAAKTAIGAMLLSANRVIAITTGGYFGAQAETNPLLHTWSLSVEEQFYLAFPVILATAWLAARQARFRKAPVMLVSVVALLSFAAAIVGALREQGGDAPWLIGFYGPLARAWEFGVGALLAMAGSRVNVRSPSVATISGTIGVIGLGVSLWATSGSSRLLPAWTLLPVSSTLLLIVGGMETSNLVTRTLGSHPLVTIGDWSYSIYLWHWPLIVFAAALWPGEPAAAFVAAGLCFVPAIASYYGIERPLRDMSTPSRRRFVSLVLATTVPPILMAAAIGFAAKSGWWSRQIAKAVEDITVNHGDGFSCITTGPFTKQNLDDCVWNAAGIAAPVYLVGDSDAWQFVEALSRAGQITRRSLQAFTSPSCPFVSRLRVTTVGKSDFFPPGFPRSGEFDHCPSYVKFTLAWLTTARPGIVFISGLDQYWWDPHLGAAIANEPRKTDPGSKATLFEKALTATVQQLQDAGHKVVIVQSIPTFRNPRPIWDPSSCSAYSLLRGACAREVSRSFVEQLQRPSRNAIVGVATTTGATVLDLRDLLCDARDCSTTKGGKWMYRDATHLSVSASYNFAPQFVEAIDVADRTMARR